MLYLVLKKDMEKISLARKYVLSDFELSKYRVTISSIVDTVRDRIQTLKGGCRNRVPSNFRIDSVL